MIALFGVLLMTYRMVVARRTTALIRGFAYSSFFLCVMTFSSARLEKSTELYVIAALLFVIKAVLIPWFLTRISKVMQVDESPGLLLNPLLSLASAVLLTYMAYLFAGRVMGISGSAHVSAFAVSLSVTLIGFFLMIFRMRALAQIVGLLTMENGLFLAAIALCKGMPFFVEIALFFDVFMCVLIMGMFMYRINRLFTHIDVSRLNGLKG